MRCYGGYLLLNIWQTALVRVGQGCWFTAAFAINHSGINTLTVADFKLPTWCHWAQNWEEMHTIVSSTPLGRALGPPLAAGVNGSHVSQEDRQKTLASFEDTDKASSPTCEKSHSSPLQPPTPAGCPVPLSPRSIVRPWCHHLSTRQSSH